MPRKSIHTVTEQLSQVSRDLLEVSRDPEWSGQNDILTRQAIPVFLRRVAEDAHWVVVIRLVNPFGKEPGIRRALGLRAPECLLRGRWDGVDALFVLSEEPTRFLDKLLPILKNEDVSYMTGYTTYSGSINHDYERASRALTLETR